METERMKALNEAKPVETGLKVYVTEVEIYDEIGRIAKLKLSDGDCAHITVDSHHTLESWKDLSDQIQLGLRKMGITT